MTKILCLGTGTLVGGFARYFLAGSVQKLLGASFPYGTLVVNLAGCFLIGFLSILAEERAVLGPQGRLLLMTGFCGAFTTFSTFILETGNLLKDGEMFRAFLNVALSLVVGFIVFRMGILIGDLI
jgi:CrcB protein